MTPGFAAYSLAWADEFDGPSGQSPDPAAWRPETGGHGWGNEELQYYTGDPANAALDGAGNLAIAVQRAPYGGREYTSARLISKNLASFCYGLIQARIKLPGGRGIWPAFWMLGGNIDQAGWPGCGEIDIMENFGIDPAEVQGAVHGPGYSGAAGIAASLDIGVPLCDDFHVYSVSWGPGRIQWYVDDTRYHSVGPRDLRGNPWVFDHDFYLLLNVAVGGRVAGPPDGTVVFPQVMLVDYIRVYAA